MLLTKVYLIILSLFANLSTVFSTIYCRFYLIYLFFKRFSSDWSVLDVFQLILCFRRFSIDPNVWIDHRRHHRRSRQRRRHLHGSRHRFQRRSASLLRFWSGKLDRHFLSFNYKLQTKHVSFSCTFLQLELRSKKINCNALMMINWYIVESA